MEGQKLMGGGGTDKKRGKILTIVKFFCFLSSSDSGQEVLLDTKTIQVDVYIIKGPEPYHVL